jgi:TolA-binding protein
MRLHFAVLILLAGLAAPAAAQRADEVERRVDRLEQELRAVQRRVFPSGRAQFVEPEIEAQAQRPGRAPVSGDALANLAARLDALEAQLRTLTGQVEEQGFRTRQIEEQLTRLRADIEGRLDRIERPAPEPEPAAPAAAEPAPPAAPAEAAEAPAEAGDPAEEAYNAGYRLWNAGRHAEAQTALNAVAARYPSSRWASWARNLEGRAYLDDDKPATAARVFLANYQDNPRGERAADSLYFLGQALARLNRRPEACRVYDELAEVYPSMRDFLRQRLPQARTDARCGTASR